VPAVLTIQKVQEIKALGVTISREFSMAQHVNRLLVFGVHLLFALRTIRHHGLPTDALTHFFPSHSRLSVVTLVACMVGFASAADSNCLEAFLRQSTTLGFGLTSDHCSNVPSVQSTERDYSLKLRAQDYTLSI